MGKGVDQSHCGVSVGNSRVHDLTFVEDVVILAASLDFLVLGFEALHEEAQPLRLQASWTKIKLQVFRALKVDSTI